MKKILLLIGIIISLSSMAQTKDEQIIRKMLADQISFWDKGDIPGFMQGYWENDSLVFIGKNGPTYGYNNTLRNYQKNYPNKDYFGIGYDAADYQRSSDYQRFAEEKFIAIASPQQFKEKANGRKVFFVHGGVETEDRENIRRIMETENDAIVVASFGTFSTGINIRNLHNIIFASPSKSRVRNLQSIGRSLRQSEGKEMATLYDIADDLRHKKKMNFTLQHFVERVKIYNEEKFSFKLYNIGLKDGK